jgi:hypothetical protein
MRFVSITGMDKTGKTTLVEALNVATNYEHYVIERDPSTVKFFAQLLNRPFYQSEYNKLLWGYKKLCGVHVCLFCDTKVLAKRFQESGEPDLPGHLSMFDHQATLVQEFIKARYKNQLLLNTSDLSVGDCVEQIIDKLNMPH